MQLKTHTEAAKAHHYILQDLLLFFYFISYIFKLNTFRLKSLRKNTWKNLSKFKFKTPHYSSNPAPPPNSTKSS